MKPTFDEIRERQEQLGTEWIYGAVQTDLAAVPLALRSQYLPTGVLQFNNVMDTNGCASRGPLNILETKLDYFYDHGMHPNLKKWFDDNGYRVNGKFALCDAFIEILSNTKPNGNSLKAPVDTLCRYGVIPTHFIPLENDMTWEQYMNPARVTQACKDLGKEFLRRITLYYEQVPLSRFTEALNDDLLDVALFAWPLPINGVYPRNDGQFSHVVACFDAEIHAIDNYEPFVKLLAKDYKFFDWGYSLSITNQTPFPEAQASFIQTILNNLLSLGLGKFFPGWLDSFLNSRVVVAPAPVAPTIPITFPPAAPKVVTAKLQDFCLAIREHEGWFPTSRSWANNNPGNCRYSSVGYASFYLPVHRDPAGFAVFKDYETGWLYLKNLVKGKIAAHPSWTLVTFFQGELDKDTRGYVGGYAPSSDGNDPLHYAQVVATKLGVTTDFQIKNILPSA